MGDKETKAYYDLLQTGLVSQETLDLVLALMGDTVNTCDAIVNYYSDCSTLEDYMKEMEDEV